MASTRSLNTPEDYLLEQRANLKTEQYFLRPTPVHPMFPGAGLLTGSMPIEFTAANACDVESSLFGIGVNNLTLSKLPAPVTPKTTHHSTLNIYTPDERVLVPASWAPQANQRQRFVS